MTIELEGGCQVSLMREGSCSEHGKLSIWQLMGRASGTRDISLRILDCAEGRSPAITNTTCEEVLFVISGVGTAHLSGRSIEIERNDGIYLAPGQALTLDNPGPGDLVLASSRCPDPGDKPTFAEASSVVLAAGPQPVVRLSDQVRETTADRWYSVMIGPDQGSSTVTQFVGSIPPGRLPEHFHRYEEVLCILEGEGVMWAGETSAPIAAGSCIYLPREQPHCVENRGDGPLVLLGVFHPAGSPANRSDT